MEELSSHCSANQGSSLGKSGFNKAAVAGKQPSIPADMVVPSVLSPPSQGTPGMLSPSHRSSHEGWPGSPCWSHVPLAEDITVPSVARRLAPAPLHFLPCFLFPFNNKKEGWGGGETSHVTSRLLRKHV